MRFLILFLCLCCSVLAQPYVDWDSVNQWNKQALDDLLNDVMFDKHFQAKEDFGCFRSWKSSPNGYNCTAYGLIMWIINETIEHDHKLGYQFLRAHIHHIVNYGYDFEKHLPGGEGTRAHPVDVPGNNWDGDYSRHVHLAPYARLWKLLRDDKDFADKVNLSKTDFNLLKKMCLDWANNWYLKTDWNLKRKRGDLFVYSRALIPVRGLVQMFITTGNYKYLIACEWIVINQFFKLKRPLEGFASYDSGFPGDPARPEIPRVIYVNADCHTSPWHISYAGESLAYLYYYTKNPVLKQLIEDVIISVTDWVVRTDIPFGDMNEKGDGLLRLSFLQGGTLTTIGNQAFVYGVQMDPLTALKLPPEVPFGPLCVLRSHLYDGGHFNTTIGPNSVTRRHYPGFGPSTDIDTMHSWADMLLARYYLTQNKNSLLWSLWIYRDSKYFANRPNSRVLKTLDNPDVVPRVYGAGNIGKTRAFSWWCRGSLWSRYILEEYDKCGRVNIKFGPEAQVK